MRISLLTQARILLLTALYAFLLLPLAPVAAQESTTRIYTASKGDTLWTIAAREFGDPFLWPLIWVYNPHITDPGRISPGERLNLTAVQKVLETSPGVEKIPLIPPVKLPIPPPAVEEIPPTPPAEEIPPAPPTEEKPMPGVVDTTPPVIVHASPAGPIPPEEPLELSAVVTDDTGVRQVLLYYRFQGDFPERIFYTNLELTLRDGDEYMVQIPGEGIRGRTLEYYLKAWDAAGNTALQGGPGFPIVVAIRTPSKEEPLLATVPPAEATQPWYQKWWVWPLVGALIGGAIMALQDRGGDGGEPSSTGSVTIIAPEP